MIVTRGQEAVFSAGFFEDAAQVNPRPPIDNDQPSFAIVDPENSTIATGVAVPVIGSDGRYEATWTPPSDAMLSADHAKWRIVWNFVDLSGHTATYEEAFDVNPVESVSQDVDKEKGYIVLQGQPAYIQNRRVRSVDIDNGGSIVAEVRVAGNMTLPVIALDAPLETIRDGNTYVYRASVAAEKLKPDTTYMIVWIVRQNAAAQPKVETELMYVLSGVWLTYMHHLDLVLNKLGANGAHELSVLSDYEKFNALNYGLKMVNSYHPNQVTWTMNSFPHDQLGHFIILAAQFWALNAAYQMQGWLAHNFSGQSTTLDFDHTGWIDSALQRALDYVTSNLTAAKTAVVRRQTSRGVVAGRPIRYNPRDSLVVPVRSYNSNNMMTLISQLGLI